MKAVKMMMKIALKFESLEKRKFGKITWTRNRSSKAKLGMRIRSSFPDPGSIAKREMQ